MISTKTMHRKPTYTELIYDMENTKLKDFNIDREATILRRRPELTRFDDDSFLDLNNMHEIKQNMARSAYQQIYQASPVISAGSAGGSTTGGVASGGSNVASALLSFESPEQDNALLQATALQAGQQEAAALATQQTNILSQVHSSLAVSSGHAMEYAAETSSAAASAPSLFHTDVTISEPIEAVVPPTTVSADRDLKYKEHIDNIIVKSKNADESSEPKFSVALSELKKIGNLGVYISENGSNKEIYSAYLYTTSDFFTESEKDELLNYLTAGIEQKILDSQIPEESEIIVSSSEATAEQVINETIDKNKTKTLKQSQLATIFKPEFSKSDLNAKIRKIIEMLRVSDDIVNNEDKNRINEILNEIKANTKIKNNKFKLTTASDAVKIKNISKNILEIYYNCKSRYNASLSGPSAGSGGT